MATNEGPKEDSTGTQSNPEGRPVVRFNDDDLKTLITIVSETLSGVPEYFLNSPSGAQDEVDNLVQGVVDDITRNELPSEPPPLVTVDDSGTSVKPTGTIVESPVNVEAASTSGMGSTQKSDSEPVATSNNENCPLPETPTADSNLVLVETDSKVAATSKGSGPVLQTTVDPCQSKSEATFNYFSISSYRNCSISETTVDPCKKFKHLIISQSLTRTTTESCFSNANETARTIVVKSPVIKTTVDSSTQVEPNDTEPILDKTIENRSIFETAGTSGESRLSLGARVDASIQTIVSMNVEQEPEALSFQEHNDTRNTSQIQLLQEPNENAANFTNLEEINQDISVEKNDKSNTPLTKYSEDEFSVEGTRYSIACLTSSSSNSSTSTDTDSTSNSSDDSQRIKKRKIEIIEEADKYPDSIFKKPKFLGRDEKVPLGETESPSTSEKYCSDVSIIEENDKENKKEVLASEGSEPNKLSVSVGDGSGEENTAPDDKDEGLGAEPDRCSGESDEVVSFALRRRPPTPPPRARGARRSTRIPKYPNRLIYYRKDQF